MRELAQHITDLIENSTAAGARRVEIALERRVADDLLVLRVSDNGRGMDADTVARASDPFFTSRTCRRVGLGLPLLAASASRSGGSLGIESTVGAGTRVTATFRLSNIDAPPVGDLKSTIVCAMVGHQDVDIVFRVVNDRQCFELDSGAIKRELGEVPLTHPRVLRWLEDLVSEGLAGTIDLPAELEEANA